MQVQEFFFKLEEIDDIAASFLNQFPAHKVFFFIGNLGAGKTTFIKKLCQKLGVVSEMSSPSFSIVNEYITNRSEKVYHVDLYRIKDESELLQIGIYDYLESGSYCFIEWPELLLSSVKGLKCELTFHECTSRKLAIFKS